jgi:outer membrane lipoprotein
MPWLLPCPPCLRPAVRLGFLLLLLTTLAACAPTISKQLQQQADQSLSFPVLAADPDAYKGKIVILGGVIAQTTTKPGQTELEIVQKNLDYFNEPETTDRSEGRFLVIADRFLDPLIYKKDRKITVAGVVTGSEVRKLNEMEYSYPVIKSQELKLWPQPSPTSWGLGGSIGWGPCGFGWGPYGYWGWGPGSPYCP